MRRMSLYRALRNWFARTITQVNPGAAIVAIASLSISGLVIGMAQKGWIEPLELRVYDRMVRLRADEGSDLRLLLVEITEDDIRQLRRSTPSDATLAQAMENLQAHRPRVVGLDLHRDLPQEPGHADLQRQLQASNVIVINKLGNAEESEIPPPPGVDPAQVGFNDLVIDPDGIIRRGLLYGGPFPSFALQVALAYLREDGITPQPSLIDPNYLQLHQAVFIPLASRSGGYQTIDDRGYQIMLNYRSSKNLARRITLTQALNRQFEAGWVRDNIVLIGTTARSGKDLFYTPYSAAEAVDHQMAGVEIHGQMISQIVGAAVDQRLLLGFWPDWVEGLWIVGWTTIASLVAWWLRHPITLGLGSVGLLLGLSGGGFLLLTHATWVPVMAPMVAVLLSMGIVVTYRAQQAHRQQQMVMTLLGQNTSPEIAHALWANRDRLLQSGKLPGQRLTATLLFTDIRGFSRISERMPPEALMDLLNEYLEAMTQEILASHGIVNKFTGDGLMAVFGVPMPRLSQAAIAADANRAVSCALAMSDRLQQLNALWQTRGLPPIQMRVGIYTGPVVAGSLGGRDRLEYGVIGDSVNIASRLESCAKDRQVGVCRILIAQETLNYVETQFQVEPWGLMELRGKAHPVEVYRVIRHAPAAASEDVEAPRQTSTSFSTPNPRFDMETKANPVNLLE